MALVVPKIVWPSGGGNTLTFIYSPRRQPYRVYEDLRLDNVSDAGVRESVFVRQDEFLIVEMDYVKAGSDIQAWDSFMTNALQGNAFDYYPDSTGGSYTVYLLEDTNWTAEYKQLGMYTFKMKFRKRVSWP